MLISKAISLCVVVREGRVRVMAAERYEKRYINKRLDLEIESHDHYIRWEFSYYLRFESTKLQYPSNILGGL